MNEYQVTWERYRSWVIEKKTKGAGPVMMIIWCVFAVICLVLTVSEASSFSLVYLWLAVFGIYRAFFRTFVLAKKQYRQLARSYGRENWTRRIAFEDDGISLTDEEKVSLRYAYSDIVKVREKGNMICLDASDRSVLRLYKDAFVESDWEDCKARLNGANAQTLPER